MSRIRANKITNKVGTGAIELETGAHLPIGMGITGAGGLNISGVVTAVAADIDDFLDVGSNIKLGNAGVITATSFSGSGAALTGIDATALKDSGGNIKIQAQASGAVYTGIHTFTTLKSTTADFSGSVSIGGTLTYEDVINVDSVGVVTARAGLKVTGGTSFFAGAIAAAGAITGTASTATNVTVADESSDTTCFPTFVTAATGNLPPKTGSNLSFNSSTGQLTATSFAGDGSGLSGISVGITTEALTTAGATVTLDLSKDDHKITKSGTYTITCTGGTEASAHTLRIVNTGITTVGFSTYFLFPSGGVPNLPTANGAVSLISFTVHRAGASGISTQLLSGASLNFS